MSRFFRRGLSDPADEVVTHDEVLRWLPAYVQRELTMAMPPEMRGWWTHDEAAAAGGHFLEVRALEDRESRFLRIGPP